jgi:multidrug efflux system membrane fusion protein
MRRWLGAAGLLACVAASSPTQAQDAAGPAVIVQAATVERRDVPVMLSNIGSVQSDATVLVRARVDGTLDRVFFTEGQEVKAGDLIAEIDPRPYAAALAAAEAKKAADQALLSNAKADLVRYGNLVRNNDASRQQLDTQQSLVAQYQANLAGDEAAIESARLNLSFCNITSPIAGRVGLRMVDPGNLIHANDATGIVAITQLRPIAVIFTLPQADLPKVQAAMARGHAPVVAESGDNQTELAQGTLETIDSTIDQSTGTMKLKAQFPNLDNKLWPGLFVNVRLQVGTLPGALVAPSIAVQHGPNGLFVYRIKPDMTVAAQPVQMAQDDGQNAVISDGLGAGDRVVTAGILRLQDGSKVALATKAGS